MCASCDCCQCECLDCRTAGYCRHWSGKVQGSYSEVCEKPAGHEGDHEYELYYDPYGQAQY